MVVEQQGEFNVELCGLGAQSVNGCRTMAHDEMKEVDDLDEEVS